MDKNKFAKTPPMGWNSYDYYDTTVTEEQVMKNADYMAKHLKKHGWEYIVVDIEWYAKGAGTKREAFQYLPFDELEMDEFSRLYPDKSRFPSSAFGLGFQPLADYIHGLGLKFGIHIMRGIPRVAAHTHCSVLGTNESSNMIADPSSICGWNPDMYGVRATKAGQAYYDSLLELYAKWGVDFIKCDDICDSWMYPEDSVLPFSGWEETRMIHRAIEKCGRPIVLSLSPGPAHVNRAWEYQKYANMWRITDDLWDKWELVKEMFRRCEEWQDHVSAGCFPDCDMLPFGRLGKGFGEERDSRLNREEQKTLMSLWCMFRSPLMIGAELTLLDDWTLSLLTKESVLALLDESCSASQVFRDEKKVIWKNHNKATGKLCVALFNLEEQGAMISISLQEINTNLGSKEYTISELWDATETTTVSGEIRTIVPAHGVKIYSFVI